MLTPALRLTFRPPSPYSPRSIYVSPPLSRLRRAPSIYHSRFSVPDISLSLAGQSHLYSNKTKTYHGPHGGAVSQITRVSEQEGQSHRAS